MIKQAIIPLAGLGTRLLPLTSVFAKELLPMNGKPGIEYILDECIEAGIKEVIFIINMKNIIHILTAVSTLLMILVVMILQLVALITIKIYQTFQMKK